MSSGSRASRHAEAAELARRLATHLLHSIPPQEDGDPVLRIFADLLSAAPKLEWVGYLSTVGVYGDHDGALVNESLGAEGN